MAFTDTPWVAVFCVAESHPAAPVSPEATRMVWPCAAACAQRLPHRLCPPSERVFSQCR